MRVQVNMIKVKPGRRSVVPEHIEELSKSISEVGLLNPVTVDRDYTLIAGLHRLEAAKLLGWKEIDCTVSSLEGLQAELAELDENFVRSDLSTVEYGELLLRRKEIYETLHPETRSGVAQATGMNRAIGNNVGGTMPMTMSVKSFTADTSEKLGVSRTTIERQIRIAKNLTPEAKELMRYSDISKKDALKVSRLPPDQQVEAARLLATGEVKKVAEYLLAHASNSGPEKLPQEEHPPAEPKEHLAHTASKMEDDDDNVSQPVATDLKAGERKAAATKPDRPKSDKPQRKKSSEAKAKKPRKKKLCADSGQQAQTHDKQPGPQSEASPSAHPFTLGERRFATFEESVADLKNPNKDCSCTPDSFLAEITEFVKKFYQEIEWFHLPYYGEVYTTLSQTQFEYFCQQMELLHTAVNQLSNHVRKERKIKSK